MNPGIDGSVELVAELNRLSAGSPVAAQAPRSKALYRYLAEGITSHPRLCQPSPDEFLELAETLVTRLGIWWSAAA